MSTTTEAERLLDLCLMTTYAARSAAAAKRAPCYEALLAELRRLAAVEEHSDDLENVIQSLGDQIDAKTDQIIKLMRELEAFGNKLESVEAEAERTARNRDMWKGQCERQAAELEALRRGEFICGKCGLRKDADASGAPDF